MTAETLLVVAWCFVVGLGGGLVGLVLGNLRLPIVLLVASSPAAGGGANIAISGVAAASASIAHIRAGRINWRLFAWMAPPSVAGALLGGYLAGVIPEEALLLTIAVVLLVSGADLLRDRGRPPACPPGEGLEIRAAVLSGALIGLLGGLVGLILGARCACRRCCGSSGRCPRAPSGRTSRSASSWGPPASSGTCPRPPPTCGSCCSARPPPSRVRSSAPG